jgi:hypothetical protein
MTKLQMLNDLKINLSNMEISFAPVVQNKSIKVMINEKINLVVSCEKDEAGAFLKVHVNYDDDLFCMFMENSDTEFTSAIKLAKKLRTMTKQYAKVETLI